MVCIDVYNSTNISMMDANILTAIYACLVIFVLVPNCVIAWGVYTHKKLKRPLNASKMILATLAVMQILFCLIAMPYHIYIVRTVAEPRCIKTPLRAFLTAFFQTLCLNVTVLMSLERHALISDRKMHRRNFSVSRTRWKILLAFAVSTAWGIAYALVLAQTNVQKLAVLYITLAIYIVLILVIAVIMNLQILRKVALGMRTSTLSLHNKRNERKLSRTITLIATVMIVCYLPIVCSLLFTANQFLKASTSGTEETAAKTLVWCMLPVYLNHALNAIVYLIRGGRKPSKHRDSLYISEKGASKRQRSVEEQIRKISGQERKISGQDHYREMKKKISTASATCEVKGGVLVIKDAERKSRVLVRQKTNFGYIDEE